MGEESLALLQQPGHLRPLWPPLMKRFQESILQECTTARTSVLTRRGGRPQETSGYARSFPRPAQTPEVSAVIDTGLAGLRPRRAHGPAPTCSSIVGPSAGSRARTAGL